MGPVNTILACFILPIIFTIFDVNYLHPSILSSLPSLSRYKPYFIPVPLTMTT